MSGMVPDWLAQSPLLASLADTGLELVHALDQRWLLAVVVVAGMVLGSLLTLAVRAQPRPAEPPGDARFGR